MSEIRCQMLFGEGAEHDTRGAYPPQSYPKMSSTSTEGDYQDENAGRQFFR